MSATRRSLAFASLDEVMPEVARLAEGHVTVGKWTLGEICNHLATTLNYAVDGFPRPMPWIVRRTIGPYFLRKVLKEGRMPDGIKAPGVLQPKPGVEAAEAIESLRAAIRRVQDGREPFPENGFFGPMTKEQIQRLQCIHCAHHLSYAVPA
ncbi:MAG: DUF1569 domain-containing protein [Isosphaeraceae bacterium]